MGLSDIKSDRHAKIMALLLGVITLALYWPALHFEFNNFDDAQYITGNARIQTGLAPGNLTWVFTQSYAANWHPITWLSHMLDWQLFGADPAGPHFENVLFHIVNTLLLFWLVRRWTGALWRSGIVAALFAWHPMHVESVAWVAERKDVLSTFFLLLTLYAYTACAKTEITPATGGARLLTSRVFLGKTKKQWLYYAQALLLFALGLMSKPMLVTLPVLLLLLDYWPLNRMQPSSFKKLFATTLEKLPFFALSALVSIMTVHTQRIEGAMAAGDLTLGWRLGNAVVSFATYVEKLFWPSNMAIFYPRRDHLSAAQITFGCLLFVVIGLLVCFRARTRRVDLVGWLWFLLTLLPVSGLFQVGEQAMADRFTYIPSIGFFIFVIWELADDLNHSVAGRRLASLGAGIILAACLLATRVQLSYWQNSATLFTHAIQVTKDNALAHCKLAQDFQAHDQPESARLEFGEALRIRPGYPEALVGLGVLELAAGKLDEAAARFEAALKIQPAHAVGHYNLGLVLFRQQKFAAAAEHFRAATQYQSGYDKAWANLGLTFAAQGKTDEARASFLQALAFGPKNAYAHNGLASLLTAHGDLVEAETHLQAALAANPNLPFANYNYGNLLLRRGAVDEAATQYRQALRLQPDDPYSHFNLANILAARKNWPEAISHYTQTTRHQPDFIDAWINLGHAQAATGQTNEAHASYEEALKLDPSSAKAVKLLQGK